MPIPVIGSVSDPEAVGLGKLLEVHCRKQTGTLFNGIDIADDDYDTVAGYVRSFFVHRTGELSMLSIVLKFKSWLHELSLGRDS